MRSPTFVHRLSSLLNDPKANQIGYIGCFNENFEGILPMIMACGRPSRLLG
jgi:hypothetical protein